MLEITKKKNQCIPQNFMKSVCYTLLVGKILKAQIIEQPHGSFVPNDWKFSFQILCSRLESIFEPINWDI